MSRTQFFPYPVAEHALTLRYDLKADHLEVGETGRILAEAVPESEPVRLALAVSVEDGTYDRVLPEDERDHPPVEVVVAVRSITARERAALKLQLSDGGWHGDIEIPKKDLFGEVTLEPMLIRTAAGDDAGYAEHIGALIADGEAVTVEIDEAPVPPGGFLDRNWAFVVEPPWGIEPQTYALRGCSRALLAGRGPALASCSQGAAGDHRWLLMAVRGHLGETGP